MLSLFRRWLPLASLRLARAVHVLEDTSSCKTSHLSSEAFLDSLTQN